eukprot:scaffold31013_cov110-Isochrysis_galbana.AAC.2
MPVAAQVTKGTDEAQSDLAPFTPPGDRPTRRARRDVASRLQLRPRRFGWSWSSPCATRACRRAVAVRGAPRAPSHPRAEQMQSRWRTFAA